MKDYFTDERHRMVGGQIAGRGLHDPRLLAAFEKVPRHLFVSAESRSEAYDDRPLFIGYGQTISQPYVVALMLNLLNLNGKERVLEVGTGSGYQAAVLAQLAQEVHTVEYLPELAASAEIRLRELGYFNVHVHVGDGSQGWPSAAPYSGIVVSAAAPDLPPPLLQQLSDGARLVLPLGDNHQQQLELITRRGEDFVRQVITGVAFVPLLGMYGWKGR